MIIGEKVYVPNTHKSTSSCSYSTCGGHVGIAWVGGIVPFKGVDRGGWGKFGDRIWMGSRATRVVAPSPGVAGLCFYLTRVQPEIYENCDFLFDLIAIFYFFN